RIVANAGGSPGEEPGGGKVALRRRRTGLDEGAAAGVPGDLCPRPVRDVLEGRTTDPDGNRGHPRPGGVEGPQRGFEPGRRAEGLLAANDVVEGDAAAVEDELGRLGGGQPQLMLDAADGQARGALEDDEEFLARPAGP